MKRLLSICLVVLLAFATSCSGKKEEAKEVKKEVKIKITNMLPADHPETKSLYKFKELAESRSKQAIKVEVYPNNQLGGPETYIDSMRMGNLEMAVPGTEMAVHQPLVAIVEMPFLFRDWDHVRKVLNDPEITAKMAEGIVDKVQVRNLGFNPVAFRQITSRAPITKMADFKGMRLRTPNIPFYIEFAKAVGANPVALPITELFTALDSKVVDGQENPYATIQLMKLYEVQKYILESRHMFTGHGYYINEKFYQTLSKENKDLVQAAVKDAIAYCYEVCIQGEKDAKDFLEKQGIKITVPDEKFRKQMLESQKTVWEYFYKKYPGTEELAKKIWAM